MRNLKRALSMALAAIMVLGLMVVGASATSYEDFTDKDEIKNKEAVNTMVSLGVISGKDNGSYDPNGSLTRAEACTLIARMLGGGKDPVLGSNIKSNFTDTKGHWAETYIAYCANLGIIVGVGDGSFNPDGTLTGTAAAKMVLCALGYKPEFEGIGGANWELATNTLATKVKLYDGLDSLNPSETISRDDVAQLIYNGVQAQEVEYRNLQGDYQGTLYATEIGTMLYNRFKVVKVEGVVAANEIFAIDGGAKTVDGKARFVDCNEWTDEKGVSHSYNDIYPVSIANDMVGRRVVIYVQFQNNLAPNAASSKVIGEPILSNENTEVSTANKMATADKVKSFLNDNDLIIGTANKDAYGVGISTGSNWTSSTTAPTLESGVIKTAGQSMTFIDNNGDNVVDYIISELASMGTVTVYDETNSKLTIAGIGSVDFKNIANPKDVAKDDVVLYVKYGDTYYLTKAETVSGKFEAYNADTSKLRMDGTEYGVSAVPLNNSGTPTLNKYSANKDLVGDSYTLYLDFYGNAVAQQLNEETLGNYAVILNSANTSTGITSKGEVKLVMADGTTGTYSVNLLASANNFGGLGKDTNADKEAAMAAILNPSNGTKYGDYTTVTNMIVTYSISGNTVTLSDPARLNDYDSTYGTFTGDVVRSNTSHSYTSGGTTTTITSNDKTIYFFVDIDTVKQNNADADPSNDKPVADAKVVVGQSNLPNSAIKKGAYSTTTNATVEGAVWDNRTSGKVASAVVVDGVYAGTENYLYVVKDELQTKDETTGETIYTYSVVFDNGEAGEIKVRGGMAEGTTVTSGNVYAYTNDGSYTALKSLANTAGFGKNNTINGYVTTYAIGNTIDIAWGINKAAMSKSMNLANDVKVINVENSEPAVVTGVGQNCSVAMATNSDGLVKVIFVKDSNVEFRTVTNKTGSLDIKNGTVNTTTGYPSGSDYTLASGATMQTAFGFSVTATNATANTNKAMTYVITPENGTKVTTEYANSNNKGEVGFTMPDYATVQITDVVGVANPSSLSVTVTPATVNTNGGTAATAVASNANGAVTYTWYESNAGFTVKNALSANFTASGATLTAKNGVTANTYYFICVVTDSQGKTAQGTVTVTVDAYTQTILNWANTGDFSVYADASQTALTEISTRVGFGVVIPDNATNVTIKNKSAWAAGNVVTFNGKDYVVDNATCITMTVEDLKADADMTIADGDFTETTTYAVTMPANGLTATWTFQTLSGTVDTTNNKVPQGATVTLAGLDGTYYVKTGTGATDYKKADGTFSMPASALNLSDKYVLINTTVTLNEDGVKAWPQKSPSGDVKVTASVAANTYVKVDDTATFTVTLGLDDTINTGAAKAITGQFSSNEATLSGTSHVDAPANVLDDNGTTLSAGVTSGVTLKVSANTAADVTVILTLAGGNV